MKGTPLREARGIVFLRCSFWEVCAWFSAITCLDCRTNCKNKAENQTKGHHYTGHIAGDVGV